MSAMEIIEQKPSLQIFLEELYARFGYNAFDMSDASTVKTLFGMWQQGGDPAQAAVLYPHLFTVKTESTFEAILKGAKQALAGHAHALRKRVEEISLQAQTAAATPNGLLYMSHSLQDLPKLGAKLSIYEDFEALLDIVYKSSGSAKTALDVAKADAVSRLVTLSDANDSVTIAASGKGYKMVIKILDDAHNTM